MTGPDEPVDLAQRRASMEAREFEAVRRAAEGFERAAAELADSPESRLRIQFEAQGVLLRHALARGDAVYLRQMMYVVAVIFRGAVEGVLADEEDPPWPGA